MTSKTVASLRYIGKDVPDSAALPLIHARILSRVKVSPSGCHEYTGYIDPYGYGDIVFKAVNWKVHRLVWVCMNGPIPRWPKAVIIHSCDNRKCINPAHLSLGSQQDNIRDCVQKNRQASRIKTHCPKGHAYAEHGREYLSDKCVQQASPWRSCRVCQRISIRRRAGWPEWALEMPPQKLGQRPDFSNAKEVKP